MLYYDQHCLKKSIFIKVHIIYFFFHYSWTFHSANKNHWQMSVAKSDQIAPLQSVCLFGPLFEALNYRILVYVEIIILSDRMN